MTSYDRTSATFRGTPAEMAQLREVIGSAANEQDMSARLRSCGLDDPGAASSDPAIVSMHEALTATIFDLELTVSGPGARHAHHVAAGINAVGVRTSPLRPDEAELNAFALVNLAGGLTRLARFRPGRDTPKDAPAITVPADALVDLADDDGAIRERAWDLVSPLVNAAGLADTSDSSWQIVQSRAWWTTPDGEPADRLGVHLRAGDQYFLVVEEGAAVALQPAPSIAAWESMIHVLPGNDEVGRPDDA